MAKFRVITKDSQRVDKDCVRTLAQMYRRALRGEFQAVAIATVTEGPDGSFGTAWSAPEKESEMAGCINYLNHRFLAHVYDS